MNDVTSVDNPRYLTVEVPTMEPGLINICRQLKPELETGTYSLIVGEGTKSRLPTLVIKGVSDEISIQNEKEKMRTFFLSTRSKDVPLEDQVRNEVLANRDPDKKVLLVTEYVASGRTLQKTTQLLTALGINFDLAILGTFESTLERLHNILPNTTRIFVGDLGVPDIATAEKYTGLNSDTGRAKREPPEASRKEFSHMREFHLERRKLVADARQDVKTMVGRVLERI